MERLEDKVAKVDDMKTQWEHPKTGKKKRCAGGLIHSVIKESLSKNINMSCYAI